MQSAGSTQGQAPDGTSGAVPSDASAANTGSSNAAPSSGASAASGAVMADVDSSNTQLIDRSAPDAGGSDSGGDPEAALPGWVLVWSDEFDGPVGAPPDSTKWEAQVAQSTTNDELEYYTDRPSNLALDGDGHLLITAVRESYMGANYTSARIDTSGKFDQTYGRFESRLKLPTGQGTWPAFWVLGDNVGQVGWPACGEIDIMENVGRAPTQNYGALHGPGYSGGSDFVTVYNLPGGYSSDFHVFAVEWEENVIRWYVDDNLYETRTPADLAARGGNLVWVYDHPFYVILNFAVGGDFPGAPNGSTPFPQSLTVDYVRVYSQSK
jgi:beta-glucanase (GH16 family)